jgi:hypothetical protein
MRFCVRIASTWSRVLSPSPILHGYSITHVERAIKKWLPRLRVLDPIQPERVGDFTENAFCDLQALGRQLINFIFRLEISRQHNKDRHDEPAKERAQDENAEGFPLR